MTKPIDILAKYQKYILALAIFLALSAVSWRGSAKDGVSLTLKNYPFVIVLLVLFSLLLVIIYIRIDQHRIKNLSTQIKANSSDKSAEFDTLLLELTERQKEVYELIVSGRSNKEIMADLFIEQSTLKSHINQIYKKLNIKTRKELKSRLSN